MDNNEQKLWNEMETAIESAKIPDEEKRALMAQCLRIKNQKVNLIITGATGCGKSSTINALFDTDVAKVGVGVDPETMGIARYELENLILWDSPGLGDGKEADLRHSKNIIDKLHETDENGDPLIDLILVILDGSTRDLGTSYELINKVIIPNLGENQTDRLLVAINQADLAMKGRYWDHEANKPEQPLIDFLDEKVASVKKRVGEATGVKVEPIYYCAGYTEPDGRRDKPYNLSKLLYYIVSNTPTKKRLAYVDNINKDTSMWEDDDELMDYSQGLMQSFGETVSEFASGGSEVGAQLLSPLGAVGEVVGGIVGGVVGGLVGMVKGAADAFRGGGGCYITTAVCRDAGKGDDCYELTAFRSFRDTWLLRQPDGPALMREYYRTAPAIVDKINANTDNSQIYRELNERYLSKCLNFIESGENRKCKELYTRMVHELQEKWSVR